MNTFQFATKWKRNRLKESASSKEHFLNLCELVGQPTPNEADPDGEWYTFEKSVSKANGRQGFADVWMRGHFGWEYKGKRKDLAEAYKQLCEYRESLGNPPLLIVCDMERFQIHTNFTGTVKEVHEFDLDGLADPKNTDLLRKVFENPEALKPGRTQKQVTEHVASQFAVLADGLEKRGLDAERVARFLVKVVFCMFAEDNDLLPANLFLNTLCAVRNRPDDFADRLGSLFRVMDTGGYFGNDLILEFNGGLFRDADALPLTRSEIDALITAAECDWSAIEPSIIGTLFLRGLDPDQRGQIGAHYTSQKDIETLLEPVLMAPLRAEWAVMRAQAETLWPHLQNAAREKALATRQKADRKLRDRSRAVREEFDDLIRGFLNRLLKVTVMDPACGSGNFLYVALQMLLALEKEVIVYARQRSTGSFFSLINPEHMRGIESNKYAQQLAQAVIWIGYLQWMRQNGVMEVNVPVISKLTTIERRDAILDLSDPARPKEPDWPDAEFIVGNPPFLGDKKMRAELGDEYVTALRRLYAGRLPGQSDLVCYWFEKARAKIEAGTVKRAGLIATQGIRGGANRTCLDRIKETGDIFFAYADRDWILDGATVHVSMVGFDDGTDRAKTLGGNSVQNIHGDLKSGDRANVTTARVLAANANLCFLGVMKAGSFDIDADTALKWLKDANPHGRPNSDVLRPRLTARDILQRADLGWIIDFGCASDGQSMALYAAPWQHVETVVKPERMNNRSAPLAQKWWLHGRSRPALRSNTRNLARFIVTPEVSKHRVFTWLDDVFLADHQTRAFTDGTDGFFGVVHSRVHELWARAKGTQLREVESGFRYTPSTCFETFPFPDPTPAQRETIAAAARELDSLRNNWLNPPEWVRREVLEFPGSWDGPWRRFVEEVDSRTGVGTVKYPRLVARAEHAVDLKKRTLTNLYNLRPAWLANAHAKLDDAVLAAYGWPVEMSENDLLAKLLELNLSRTGTAAGATTEDEPEA